MLFEKFDFQNVVESLSLSMEILGTDILEHSRRVAYIALCIAEERGLSEEDKFTLYVAAILHDCGASSSTLKEKLLSETSLETINHKHAKDGYDLLRPFRPFEYVAQIVRKHHTIWGERPFDKNRTSGIDLFSNIIFLADRVDILLKNNEFVLHQRENILQQVEEGAGNYFIPELLENLRAVSSKESFWLDLTSGFINELIAEKRPVISHSAGIENLKGIAGIFSRFIDRKSTFTQDHSSGVAQVAVELFQRMGMGRIECDLLEIAGLLHDLGKLSIPDKILNKPGGLSKMEWEIISSHTYYTFHILNKIKGFEEVREWASFHHENLLGTGYPFKKDAAELSLGSRVIGVADIFHALTQDRPYRDGMNKEEVIKIMSGMSKEGKLDTEIVDLLVSDYDPIYEKV